MQPSLSYRHLSGCLCASWHPRLLGASDDGRPASRRHRRGRRPKHQRCHTCARDAYRASLAPYSADVIVIHETEAAVLVRHGRADHWVPRAAIFAESEVPTQREGLIVMAGWLAVEDRWPNAGAAAHTTGSPPAAGREVA